MVGKRGKVYRNDRNETRNILNGCAIVCVIGNMIIEFESNLHGNYVNMLLRSK